MIRPCSILALVLTVAPFISSRAENWPQWRGPAFNGSSPESGLPSDFSTTEKVHWKTPLAGYSGATPVIWDNSVFVVTPDSQKNLNLICIDRADGKVRWEQTVGIGDRSQGRNNMASCSPATDGQRVIALFGTGDLAAFDFAGKQLWHRNLGRDFGKFSIMWLYGSSPLLYDGKLYVQVLQRNPPVYSYAQDRRPERESYLLCIDPATGKDLWRHIRKTDAPGESQEAYSTPIPFTGSGRSEILILGGDCITGHNPSNGDELWRWCGLNPTGREDYRTVPSAVAADGVVLASAPKGSPVFALKAGESGSLPDSAVAWEMKENTTDWSTPLYYRNRFYILDGSRHVMTCVEPKTGREIWHGDLGARETFWASPTGADGKIYCIGERGTVVILEAGDEFKILSTIPLKEDPCRGSIAVAHRQLFIRTAAHLYCIGQD